MKIHFVFAVWFFALTGLQTALVSAQQPNDSLPDFVEAERDAIRYLVDRVSDEGWLTAKSIGGNEPAKRQIAAIMTAYLLLVMDDPTVDQTSKQRLLDQADQIIQRRASSFGSWREGFASIYLFEESLRQNRPHPLLQTNAKRLIDLQNSEGGWAHGNGIRVRHYPTTVVAVANLALISFGAIEQFELQKNDPDFQDSVADALELYTDIQSTSGALPYGGRPYKKGFQSGRTAGALIGLAALNQTETELFLRATDYTLANINTIPFGHASPALHVALGGLATSLLSNKTWQAYRAGPLHRLLKLQQEDGSFNDIAGDSPDSIIVSTDPHVDAAYRTAMYMVGLTANRAQIATSLRRQVTQTRLTDKAPRSPLLTAASTLAIGGVESVTVANGTLFGVTDDEVFSVPVDGDGPVKRKPNKFQGSTQSYKVGEKLLVLDRIERETEPIRIADLIYDLKESKKQNDGSSSAATKPLSQNDSLTCFDSNTLEEQWRIPILSETLSIHACSGKIKMLQRNGQLVTYDLNSGAKLGTFAACTGLANIGVAFDTSDCFAAFGESLLQVFDAEGKLIWKRRTRTKRGVAKPAFTQVAYSGEILLAGSSDGLVQCFDSAGTVKWKVQLGGSISRLAVVADEPESVIAVCGGGIATKVCAGKIEWQTDVVESKEQFVEGSGELERPFGRLLVSDDQTAIEVVAREEILLVSNDDGKILSRIPAPIKSRAWVVVNSKVWVAAEEEIRLYED